MTYVLDPPPRTLVFDHQLSISISNKQVHVKELVINSEQEFSISTFTAHFKIQNLFLLFLLTLKCFLGYFIVCYEMLTTNSIIATLTILISLVTIASKRGQGVGFYILNLHDG